MLVRLLIAAGYPAGLIAVWGLTSLITDTDVITLSDAGPLLGPSMAVAATVVTAAWVLTVRRALVLSTVGAVASAYLAMLIVGSIGYVFTRGDAAWFVLFAARFALSPFVIGAALLSGAAVVLAFATSARAPFDPPNGGG
jgi:hypothetical protein